MSSHWWTTLIALLEWAHSTIRGIKASFVHWSSSVPCRAVIVASLREIEGGVQRGWEGASLWSSASRRTICLVLAQHSVPLCISIYKYIHFSHPAFQTSHAPRWVTLARRWEARADWSRAEWWEQSLPSPQWWKCGRRKGAGCARFDGLWNEWCGLAVWSGFIIYTVPSWLMGYVCFQQLDITASNITSEYFLLYVHI